MMSIAGDGANKRFVFEEMHRLKPCFQGVSEQSINRRNDLNRIAPDLTVRDIQARLRRESANFCPLRSKCTTLRSCAQVYLCPQSAGGITLERVVGGSGTENTNPVPDELSGIPREGKGTNNTLYHSPHRFICTKRIEQVKGNHYRGGWLRGYTDIQKTEW